MIRLKLSKSKKVQQVKLIKEMDENYKWKNKGWKEANSILDDKISNLYQKK